MYKVIYKFYNCLPKKYKYELFIIQILFIISAFTEALSILSIAPFASSLFEGGEFEFGYLKNIFTSFDLTNKNMPIIFGSITIILFSITLIINLTALWITYTYNQKIGAITKYQIFKYQNHAYGIQFHIEIKDTTVNEWGCVPEYKEALEDQLGDGALDKFDNAAKDNMSDMNNYSKILYDNFKKIL